jgi:hypothetical protein
MQAIAPFDIGRYEAADPYDDQDGVALSRAAIQKTFRGDIEGESTLEMLAAHGPGGPAGYVAIERVTGSVHGRAGSFVLLHAGTMTAEGPWAVWPIVPGSGTGALAGIRGEGRIDMDADGAHTFTLDYELG